MEIEVRVFANLREILGTKQIHLKFNTEPTIREVLNEIRARFPSGEAFFAELYDSTTDSIKDFVKIMVNGKILFKEEALNYKVKGENIVIAIFPPVGGGIF